MAALSFLYDFTSLTKSIDTFLYAHMPSFWALMAEMTIIGVCILGFYAVVGLYLVLAERKVCAFLQNRLGPNRIGPYGIFQTVADLVKLLYNFFDAVQLVGGGGDNQAVGAGVRENRGVLQAHLGTLHATFK